MKGEILYKKLSKRDYSGSVLDKYAQLLQTILFNIVGNNEKKMFFDLLEKANLENKRIEIKEESVYNEEIFIEDLFLR